MGDRITHRPPPGSPVKSLLTPVPLERGCVIGHSLHSGRKQYPVMLAINQARVICAEGSGSMESALAARLARAG